MKINFLRSFVFIFLFFLTINSFAENPSKTVKVGWYHSAQFQEGMNDEEEKSGYSYKYLHGVSDYTGWNYKYVYGEWADLFEKLQKGEIDILAGVSITEERKQYFLFPNYSMGTDKYYLYQHDNQRSMNLNDLSTFTGKKIGGVKNNRMTYFLEEWAKANNVDFDLVLYEGFTERDRDFSDYKLDGISATDNNIHFNSGYSAVVKVGEEPFYLAITKNRNDLLQDLNGALGIMENMDPYFLQNLQYSCYGTALTNSKLSDEEINWVETHKELKIGYMDNYLPYCKTNSKGKATGLLTDVVNAILEQLHIKNKLKLIYKPYANYDDMVDSIKIGEVDAVFPIGGNLWEIDLDGLDCTASVLTAGMNLVYKGSYSDVDLETMAINQNNKLQLYYVKENFPNAKHYLCDSIEECIKAVESDKAQGTILNGLRVNLVRNKSKYNNLSILQLEKMDSRYFGVLQGNVTLLLLLNRGIKLIGQDYGSVSSYKYMDEFYAFTTIDFIKNNLGLIATIVFFIICVIGFFLIRDARISKQQALQEIQLNKKLDKTLREAENANNAKTAFLFNMSHDIRTPMNAIIGFTNLLDKYQDFPERRQDYLKKIQDSSSVLLSILNNVLEMARIEKGTIEIDESAWNVEYFVETSITVIEELMRQKKIDFSYQINISNKYVFCDSTKLREIVLNILSNSYKYTPEGGKVFFLMEEIPYDKEGWTLFKTTISDSGIGMSQDFLPHIFDEFSREKNTTENKIEGTGLGMSIVKRLLESMNGEIEVASEKGVGTTFIFTIPHRIAHKEDLLDCGGIELDSKIFKDKRILLAEDNDLNAEIAIEVLSNLGFKVQRAVDGLDCLDMLKKSEAHYYDLILMDIQMPKMNGYETTGEIRILDEKEKSDIPIFAMTANAFEEDKAAALKSGMNGHISKPIDIKELIRVLTEVIS